MRGRFPAPSEKARSLYFKYGVTPEKIKSMLAEQGNACRICKREFRGTVASLVDHCHKTGLVRALLCHNCNVGLGMFRDDPTRLLTAIEYVLTQGKLDKQITISKSATPSTVSTVRDAHARARIYVHP